MYALIGEDWGAPGNVTGEQINRMEPALEREGKGGEWEQLDSSNPTEEQGGEGEGSIPITNRAVTNKVLSQQKITLFISNDIPEDRTGKHRAESNGREVIVHESNELHVLRMGLDNIEKVGNTIEKQPELVFVRY